MKSIGNKMYVCLQLMGVYELTFLVVLANLDSFSAVTHHCGITRHYTSTMFCIVCTRQMVASLLDSHLRWFNQYCDHDCKIVGILQVIGAVYFLCDLVLANI